LAVARFWPLLRVFGAALLLAGSLAFLAYSLLRDWQQLVSYQWQLDLSQLPLALLFLVFAFLITIAGWHLISIRLGGSLGLERDAEIYCLTVLARRLPGPLWHIVGRVYLYQRGSVPRSVTLWGSFWELAIQEFSGLLVVLVFLPFFPQALGLPVAALAAATGIFALVVLFPNSLKRAIGLLWRPAWLDPVGVLDRRSTLGWVGLYFVGWLQGGPVLLYLARSLTDAPLPSLPAAVGFVTLAGVVGSLLFFLPADTGIREVSLSLLLSYYVPLPVAIAIAILFRVVLILGEAALALSTLLIFRVRRRLTPK
jgi:glycosyltransferase 2 family protein